MRARQYPTPGFFFGGEVGHLGGVLSVGGLEHASVGFPRLAADLVEPGAVSLVRWGKNGVVETLAGVRRIFHRFGVDLLGGALSILIICWVAIPA